jgi:acetoin utilization deacetylase AcuC-like enzyme
MTKTAIIWEEKYLEHLTGRGHPERPQRLKAVKEVIDADSSLIHLPARMATEEELEWVHTKEHIAKIQSTAGDAVSALDVDTRVSELSCEAAFLAAGGLLTAVEAVEKSEVDNAFAFPRPPGHHAESDKAMGFCLFNNVAVAAEYLIHVKGKKRVAIVDFDVHHGNGTQRSFYKRKDVFYTSAHRFPFYPGTGAEHETGLDEGEGYTLNVPLSSYGDDDDYAKAFEEKIVPALIDYKPEFLLVSAGFDAHLYDPIGGMKVTKAGFTKMSEDLVQVAKQCCEGKTVYVLEGGYDLKGLQEGVESVFTAIR